jgi:hypothetical protein
MATLQVGSGKTYSTIQAAITASKAGDTISIDAGTYNETITVNKGITITGAGIDQTIINGINGGNGILINAAAGTLTISSITVNGTAGASAGIETAALYIKGANGTVDVNGCKIVANGDSAITLEGGASAILLRIRNNTITGNTYLGTNTPAQTWSGSYFSAQFTTTNIPRQLVVINSSTIGAAQFTGNILGDGTNSTGAFDTAGIYRSNTVMTCDAPNVTISGNIYNTACYSLNTGSVALRVRGNGCTVSNNTFVNPVINGYILDNKTLSGANGTNNVTYSKNTIDFTTASKTNGHTVVASSYSTAVSGFTRNCWSISGFTTINGVSALPCIGLGKIIESDKTTLLVAPATGTSGSYDILGLNNGTAGTAINDAVNGNVIQMAPGTYACNAYITKSVTIKGVRGPNGNATDSTVINPSTASGWPISVRANNVSIQDLIIDDTFSGSSAFNNSGAFLMHISNAPTTRVENIMVKNIKFQNSRRRGVAVDTANNVTFDGCEFPLSYNYALGLASCQNLIVKGCTLPLGAWGTVGIFPTGTAVDMNTIGKSINIDLSQDNKFADGAISGASLTYNGGYMTKAMINIQPVVGSSNPAGDITFGYDSTANVKLPIEFAYAIKAGATSSLLNYNLIRERYTPAAVFLEYFIANNMLPYLIEKDMAAGTLIVEDRFPVLKALELANNEPVLLTNASQIPANASMTVNKEIRDATGKKMIYSANVEAAYSAIAPTEVANIMPGAVNTSVPVVAVAITKSSTGEYTEPVKPKAASGILSKDLFVTGSSDLLALGITPPQIVGSVSASSIPTFTPVDIAPLLGAAGQVTLSATNINIPDTLSGKINLNTLSDAIKIDAGITLEDTVGNNKLVIAKPAADIATTIPVRIEPNNISSSVVANILLPPAAPQRVVEIAPNGIVTTSGGLTFVSNTDEPMSVINMTTGIKQVGTDVSVSTGGYALFTPTVRVELF